MALSFEGFSERNVTKSSTVQIRR